MRRRRGYSARQVRHDCVPCRYATRSQPTPVPNPHPHPIRTPTPTPGRLTGDKLVRRALDANAEGPVTPARHDRRITPCLSNCAASTTGLASGRTGRARAPFDLHRGTSDEAFALKLPSEGQEAAIRRPREERAGTAGSKNGRCLSVRVTLSSTPQAYQKRFNLHQPQPELRDRRASREPSVPCSHARGGTVVHRGGAGEVGCEEVAAELSHKLTKLPDGHWPLGMRELLDALRPRVFTVCACLLLSFLLGCPLLGGGRRRSDAELALGLSLKQVACEEAQVSELSLNDTFSYLPDEEGVLSSSDRE